MRNQRRYLGLSSATAESVHQGLRCMLTVRVEFKRAHAIGGGIPILILLCQVRCLVIKDVWFALSIGRLPPSLRPQDLTRLLYQVAPPIILLTLLLFPSPVWSIARRAKAHNAIASIRISAVLVVVKLACDGSAVHAPVLDAGAAGGGRGVVGVLADLLEKGVIVAGLQSPIWGRTGSWSQDCALVVLA